ncbi:MAG: 3-deoxy-D-manno-octulosonic acid transferase [Pseudomonadota bacterium]
MLLGLYKVATYLGAPLLSLQLRRRVRAGKEDPTRLSERQGQSTYERPDGPLFWIHAASVGESLLVLPLIESLLDERPAAHALVTTGTVTSATLMADRLPSRAFHQFAPLDQAFAWRRFFDHWQPDLGCLVESEIWPHLILEAERSSIPLVLINGRMSSRSASRWRFAPTVGRRLLGSFALCLARSQVDAGRLSTLGAPDVRMLGDLKHATPPLPYDTDEFAKLKAAIGDRPVWLAASTHPGEEIELLSTHQHLRNADANMLTVIVPRHPGRGTTIKKALEDHGVTTAQRSLGEPISSTTGIYLADTLGELGLFYRLAKLAFIGGSLVPHGGQNPIEAARLGCPPLFGPHTGNFEDMTNRLLVIGAARRVQNADELARTVATLLIDPTMLDAMTTKGIEAGIAEASVLDHVQRALEPLLERYLGPMPPSIEPHRASA